MEENTQTRAQAQREEKRAAETAQTQQVGRAGEPEAGKEEKKAKNTETEHGEAAYRAFCQQAAALQQAYPQAELRRELRNPEFMRRVAAGMDMTSAYELAHRHEMLAQAMAYAIARSREQIAAELAAGACRPQEGAMTARSAQRAPADPANWSRQEREEVRKRVMRGERIRL